MKISRSDQLDLRSGSRSLESKRSLSRLPLDLCSRLSTEKLLLHQLINPDLFTLRNCSFEEQANVGSSSHFRQQRRSEKHHAPCIVSIVRFSLDFAGILETIVDSAGIRCSNNCVSIFAAKFPRIEQLVSNGSTHR